MKIGEMVSYLDSHAPVCWQEPYDNAGLILGNPGHELAGVLISLDVTEAVIEEAVKKKINMVVAHHPLIFSGLKKVTGSNYTERTVELAIKHSVAVYSAHTNLDAVHEGVNAMICRKLGLKNPRILRPKKGVLSKLVTFVPSAHLEAVGQAVFDAGAGHIGNYDQCSYRLQGHGTFRALEGSSPFVGKKGKMHVEEEVRFETIFPSYLQERIIDALLRSHPYEEVAYDIYPLNNVFAGAGEGMIGTLPDPLNELKFLQMTAGIFMSHGLKHSDLTGKQISEVAVCGGSGSHLLADAVRAGAHAFITSDIRYHQFFDADGKILVADIGHYESEQFTKQVFYELITKNFPNFAVQISETNTNPVKYL